MFSESLPSYSEIYEAVLDRVERKIAESKSLADREAFAQDIMDALAEAYSIGHHNGVTWMASAATGGTIADRKTNPYERTPNA